METRGLRREARGYPTAQRRVGDYFYRLTGTTSNPMPDF